MEDLEKYNQVRVDLSNAIYDIIKASKLDPLSTLGILESVKLDIALNGGLIILDNKLESKEK